MFVHAREKEKNISLWILYEKSSIGLHMKGQAWLAEKEYGCRCRRSYQELRIWRFLRKILL